MQKLNIDLQKFSLENIEDLSNKRVILRSCLNVAVDSSGRVTDSTRIEESAKSIKFLAENAKQLIILGHLGRPKNYSQELSFWDIHRVIEQETRIDIEFAKFGKEYNQEAKAILFDNIRFFEDEESKDVEKRLSFAKDLSELADVFVNDAFADYRESASTFDIASVLPSYLGFKFIEEVEQFSKLENPNRPYVAVLGGAKLSEKLDVLNSLGEHADQIIIGGAMAYTLMKAKGISIGNSKIEEDKLDVATEIITKYGNKLILPLDHIIADEFSEYSPYEITDTEEIPQETIAIDIGPKTIDLFSDVILNAQTILWNGPMGVFEWEHSAKGTKEIGRVIENSSAYKLLGGGDTIASINKFKLENFNHICTGGGAMLAFIANNNFPTLDVVLKS